MTRRTAITSPRIRIWSGCAASVARAVWRLQLEWEQRLPKNRYRAIPSLVRLHIEPALRACITKAVGGPGALDCTFYDGGMSATVTDPARLDRLLCLLNRRTHGLLAGSIDTLREMGQWIADQRPARVVPTAKKSLKGEKRSARGVVDYSKYRDWPYCKHCGQFSTLAASLAGANGKSTSRKVPLSAQFCERHNPATSPAASRRYERFRSVLTAIKRELATDEEFRAAFTQRAWDTSGLVPQPHKEIPLRVMRISHPSLITDPVKSYARECAALIAKRNVDDTEIAIARLRAEGKSQAEIARRLGLSRQVVSQRISKTTGYFDFARRSPRLYWWPDKVVLNDPEIKPAPRTHADTLKSPPTVEAVEAEIAEHYKHRHDEALTWRSLAGEQDGC